MIGHLGWATTGEARGRDDDEPLALAALTAAGISVEVVDWDDPAVRWAGFDRVVLRSTWDYAQRLPEFHDWLDRVGAATDLVNPAPLVRWNLDKRYLAELAAAGVPVIDSAFVEPGAPVAFPGTGFVVKPAVGAGSRDVASYRPDQHDPAARHVDRLHRRGATALVQPLIGSVAEHGEWALLFFGGRYSHAANKRVALTPGGETSALFLAESLTGHDADDAQLTVARAAVDAVAARFGTPAYARVDLVRDDEGGYRVLELELVEPSLFLPQGGPAAAARLAEVLATRPVPPQPAVGRG